jgi:DNA-binding transcriptional LysR family regulator
VAQAFLPVSAFFNKLDTAMRVPMTLFRKFEYLIGLAKEGHFARAAAACNISQPTLSAALRQLEIEIGVTIVKRGQRYGGLTEEGERVLAFAQKITAAYEHLLRELQGQGSDSAGTLQVGVIPSAMPLVSSLAVAFRRQYPNNNLKLLELVPGEIRRGFEAFTLDIAVTYLEERLTRRSRTHLLFYEEYSFLIRANSAGTRRKVISWDAAARFPLCLLASEMLEPGSKIREFLRDATRTASRLEINSTTALHAHLRSGVWAAILPRPLAIALELSGDLLSIPLPDRKDPAPVGIVIPSREAAVPLAEGFFRLAASSKPVAAPARSQPRRGG